MSFTKDLKSDAAAGQEDAVRLLVERVAASSLLNKKTATVHTLPATTSPAAFGLFGLAVCNMLHMGPFLGIVNEGADHLMYSFALFFGGIGQLVAGGMEYQRKNTWACITWLCYSGYWMGYGWSGMQDGDTTNEFKSTPASWVMANILWGVVTLILWLATFAFNGVLCLMMFLLTVQFFLEAAAATHESVYKATGVVGFIVSTLAFYIGASVLFQEVYQKDLLPLFPLDWTKLRGRRQYGATGTRKDLAPKLEPEEDV
ncbi:GPR1 FUN34 yaaH family protein [Micractinium conductrix]|uniref:GPR1 FUN34 yaaH family protein n=1 Tax=Micractinium conductrix TaxID=554055 RepID=A0A2P6VGP1_9CHLO|nr:GPR1 FUN34 yaaH family protein [Micractinium conductrix]|eukprot:PSC73259.1 GPR1 FUN34 yaaH family protein [Micractinium conductrix]